ncbi:MAG: P-loop NTPase fold protein [Pyrinomonadaceae bacterium]
MSPEGRQLEDELIAALSIEDERLRVEKLLELAPSLAPEPLDRVLVSTNYLHDAYLRSFAIATLAPYLNEEQLDKAATFASRTNDLAQRNFALGSLGPFLSEETRANVIETIRSTPIAQDRLRGWVGLAPYLTSDLKQEAISTALTLTDEVQKSEALVALVPYLPDVWKMRALDSAKSIANQPLQLRTLSRLIPSLPRREQAKTLNEALALARELPDQFDRSEALLDLAPLMPIDLKEDLFKETHRAISAIEDPVLRVETAVRLADTLPLKQAVGYLQSTAINQPIDDEHLRGEVLTTLALKGPSELHPEILDAARKIKDPKVKSSVIIQLQSIIEQEPSTTPPRETVVDISEHTPPPIQDFPDAVPSEESKPDSPIRTTGRGEAAADAEPGGGSVGFSGVPSSVVEPIVPPPVRAEQAQGETAVAPPQGAAPKKPSVDVPELEELFEPTSPEGSRGVKAFLHSDRWATEDQLDYMPYADAITEFILHPDTKPPLAIGILAPWGQGKTTLMRLIQNQLQAKVQGRVTASPTGVVVPPITPSVRFGYLRQWIQDPTNYKLDEAKLLNRPTVWFNAWKYQNTEQLWAGMAYSILSQLVEQIESQEEREKFWLALQAERVDFNAIRTDIHRMIFERVAPWIGISMIGVVLGILLIIVGFFAGGVLWGSSGGIVMLAGVLVPAVKWLVTNVKVNSKPLEGKFAQYVRQPTYEGKLGFFHEIEMDVQRVFRLLIAKGKPAVVFIDDLDRCSPGTVAQVIEAMNLFLSAEFPDCYFVVGMDAQVVAASMEVAYENLDKKMKGVTRSYGSLGWYFMDKFIQLQFSIPNLTDEQRNTYLNKLMGQAGKKEPVAPAELDKVEQQLEANLNSNTLKTEEMPAQAAELSKLRLQRPESWQRLTHTLIKARAQQLTDDNPTLQKHIQRYEPFLGASPRGIKRFTNLLRFYDLCQVTRRAQGLQASSESALARWLVIMLRWPQVVRWIQWEGEAKFNAGSSALKKAEVFEEELLGTKDHATWLKYLSDLDPNYAEWMGDKQLYEFLKSTASSSEKLSLAVKTGVW